MGSFYWYRALFLARGVQKRNSKLKRFQYHSDRIVRRDSQAMMRAPFSQVADVKQFVSVLCVLEPMVLFGGVLVLSGIVCAPGP
jgi:hypothetical protein